MNTATITNNTSKEFESVIENDNNNDIGGIMIEIVEGERYYLLARLSNSTKEGEKILGKIGKNGWGKTYPLPLSLTWPEVYHIISVTGGVYKENDNDPGNTLLKKILDQIDPN